MAAESPKFIPESLLITPFETEIKVTHLSTEEIARVGDVVLKEERYRLEDVPEEVLNFLFPKKP